MPEIRTDGSQGRQARHRAPEGKTTDSSAEQDLPHGSEFESHLIIDSQVAQNESFPRD